MEVKGYGNFLGNSVQAGKGKEEVDETQPRSRSSQKQNERLGRPPKKSQGRGKSQTQGEDETSDSQIDGDGHSKNEKKMKLKEYKDTFYYFSGKASDISRQLAFAGIAVIWLFRLNVIPPKIPSDLLIPLALLVSALFFDLAQYGTGTIIWGVYQWKKERDLQEKYKHKDLSQLDEVELDHPSWLKSPQLVCFSIKITCIFVAYFLIAKYVFETWV